MSGPYFNRELSWVEFNARVLAQAENREVPLLERLKFLSIVSSNFDEFFMVRVATIKRQYVLNRCSRCPTGMSARDQLNAIRTRIAELTTRKYEVLLHEIFPALAKRGVVHVERAKWSPQQYTFIKRYFREQVLPLLTPVRATGAQTLPEVGNLKLHAAFLLEPKVRSSTELLWRDEKGSDGPYMVLVQIPSSIDRVVFLPSETGDEVAFTFLEQVILSEAYQLFPGFILNEQILFRITRDADFGVDEERDEDFIEAMEEVVEGRDRSVVVRLNVNQSSANLKRLLREAFSLVEEEVYETPDPLELRTLMRVAGIDRFDDLREPPWPTMQSVWIDPDEPIWNSIRKRDILLHHPYESFDPVVRIVREAADDPATLAIKMTLYRTSGNSPIVQALERAAENGKQVSVVVELKARFDEERNIGWAQRLERAGVIVVYGIARLKVHAKALLIVRRERSGIKRYVHLGTGNYNDKTSRAYTDLGLLSCEDTLCYEVGQFFNAITGYSVIPTLQRLAMAPVNLKSSLIDLIQREATRARDGGNAMIMAKMNSLADPVIIEALYDASRAGVEVKLNVRGICMLVPGIPGTSDRIEVTSILDRYLEHTRAFYFENGGNPNVFISSADWMPRNLDKRVELLVAIEDVDLRRHIRRILETNFADTSNSHRLLSDGRWERRTPTDTAQPPVRAQRVAWERIRQRIDDGELENRQEFSVRRRPAR